MSRWVVLAVAGLMGSAQIASAQPNDPPTAQATPADSTKSTESQEEPLVGDHWTYDIRDEITGDFKSTIVQTITDVTATEISIRVTALGNNNTSFLTFDRAWNLKNNGVWRYTPNDGSGVANPLAPNKTWALKSTEVNSSAGAMWKRSGTSKVLGQESITTRAGTFDVLKIQTTIHLQNSNDPTKKLEVVQLTWYSTAVNHWVKRMGETRIDGKLREKSSAELVEYGRRD